MKCAIAAVRVVLISVLFPLCSCNSGTQSIGHGQNSKADRQEPIKFINARATIFKELGTQSAQLAPSATIRPSLSPDQSLHLDPAMMSSFAQLAKLYEQRDENVPQTQRFAGTESMQTKMAYLQRFCQEQYICTMVFSYQLLGKYKEAADILAERIRYLESANVDHSKDHALANSYSQYSGYLNHLGRGIEAEQMLAKARSIEPNHY